MPGMPFGQCMTIRHSLGLQRRGDQVVLTAAPVRELESLRVERWEIADTEITPARPLEAEVSGELLDVEAELELGAADRVGVVVRGVPVVYGRRLGAAVLRRLHGAAAGSGRPIQVADSGGPRLAGVVRGRRRGHHRRGHHSAAVGIRGAAGGRRRQRRGAAGDDGAAAVSVAGVSLTVTPIAGALGAEVAGVDLSRSLDMGTVAEIRQALLDHLVIFFSVQELTPKSLLAFARCLAEPLAYPQLQGLPEEPLVTAVTKLEHERVAFGGVWHTDTSYLERPPMGSLLYAVELPPYGGDTLFANQYLAYERLSEGLRRTLADLTRLHLHQAGGGGHAPGSAARARRAGEGADHRAPGGAHPPRDRPQGTVRQLRAHLVLQGLERSGEQTVIEVSVSAPGSAGVHLPLPLAARLPGDLGQPLHPTPADQRLPRLPARDVPRHTGGRSGVLKSGRPAAGGWAHLRTRRDRVTLALSRRNSAIALLAYLDFRTMVASCELQLHLIR